MTKELENLVVEYTKSIHPKDLGKKTGILENNLREALKFAYEMGKNDEKNRIKNYINQ